MKKQKWRAALLNLLVPGLGAAYVGKMRKAAILYFLFLVIALTWPFMAYTYPLFVAAVTIIVFFWIYLAVSGYRDVPENNASPREPDNKPPNYWLAIFVHSLIVAFIAVFVYREMTRVSFAKIPSPSMDPGLKVGDRLAYERTSSIKRNDVVIFWVPYDTTTMYAQRCIGLPGDSLRIENAIVIVNNAPLTDLPVKYKYLVRTNGSGINARLLEDYHITDGDYGRVAQDAYFMFLSDDQAKELKKVKIMKTVELSIATKGEREPGIFPKEWITHDWNLDFYGPLYIPRRGDKISLTSDNAAIYMGVIQSENNSVEAADSGLMINGTLTTQYEFKENYYFIMGDNRHNALDSRYWGLLPESLVIGKALYLYWSEIPDRIGMKVK